MRGRRGVDRGRGGGGRERRRGRKRIPQKFAALQWSTVDWRLVEHIAVW